MLPAFIAEFVHIPVLHKEGAMEVNSVYVRLTSLICVLLNSKNEIKTTESSGTKKHRKYTLLNC